MRFSNWWLHSPNCMCRQNCRSWRQLQVESALLGCVPDVHWHKHDSPMWNQLTISVDRYVWTIIRLIRHSRRFVQHSRRTFARVFRSRQDIRDTQILFLHRHVTAATPTPHLLERDSPTGRNNSSPSGASIPTPQRKLGTNFTRHACLPLFMHARATRNRQKPTKRAKITGATFYRGFERECAAQETAHAYDLYVVEQLVNWETLMYLTFIFSNVLVQDCNVNTILN